MIKIKARRSRNPDARRRIWGWWFFDWANQPYSTLLMTFIFSIYFAEIARDHYIATGMAPDLAGARAQELWSAGLAIAGAFIAVLAPVLGAIADATGRRMVWIWGFSLLYVVGAAGLWYLTPESPALVQALILFGIGLIGMEFTTIFTNALLPSLAPQQEIGHISGAGFAFGYLGGVVALALMLGLFADNAEGKTLLGLSPAFGLDGLMREGTRFSGPFTAIWYIIFMIPFALWVREPALPQQKLQIGVAVRRLGALIASLRHRKSLSAWLASSMFSRDALNALYGLGGVFAGGVLGWSVIQSGIFGIIAAIAAAVISWIGGRADRHLGPKPVIIASTLALIAVCVLVLGLKRDSLFGIPTPPALATILFYICGAVIGGAGGALQASSRTLMVLHTTAESAAEGFGLYALSGKATAFLAPALVSLTTRMTGSQNIGITPLIGMFILSLALLGWVKKKGETQ